MSEFGRRGELPPGVTYREIDETVYSCEDADNFLRRVSNTQTSWEAALDKARVELPADLGAETGDLGTGKGKKKRKWRTLINWH